VTNAHPTSAAEIPIAAHNSVGDRYGAKAIVVVI
jgi:hypothetical protein